ncbi:MAG: hypothetical protein ABI847_00630 [Anaerolineales bacterium]
MPSSESAANYHAYLIRLWRDGRQAPWRASVTHAATGEVQRFAAPELAWAYLQAKLAGTGEINPVDGAESHSAAA